MASIPGIVQNLIVQTANRVNLVSWDLSTGATSYIVNRSLDNITYSTIATLSGSPLATSYQDTAVIAGIQYWYQVAASSRIGSINFTGQPNPGDTATINTVTFTAVTGTSVGTQFTIGSTLMQTIDNFSQVANTTIPGDVATTDFTGTELIVIALSSTITDLTSALTNTTVTPFTIGGTSQFTPPQSIIPAQTGEISLAQLRLQAMQRADRVNSEFVTTSEWNQYIKQSMFELYDLLVTIYEDYFLATPIQFTSNGTTFQFPLPDGVTSYINGITLTPGYIAPSFYKIMGVDLALQTANNAYVTINKFNFIDRNRFVYPNTASTIYGVFNLQYRVLGNIIEFIPTPTAGQGIRVWYIPRMTELLADTDTTSFGINGWIEYVIVRAAKYALDKEESDTTILTQEIAFLKQRIEESGANRDAGQPDKISDTRSGNGNGFGTGGFGSGYNGGTGGW